MANIIADQAREMKAQADAALATRFGPSRVAIMAHHGELALNALERMAAEIDRLERVIQYGPRQNTHLCTGR